MLILDKIVNKNKKIENKEWPFRMLIIGPSGSSKTNALLHLINNLHPIDKIYLYAKDLAEPKYEYLINKRESNDYMNDVFDDISNYNKTRDKKVLIIFDDMIGDIEYNKNFKNYD